MRTASPYGMLATAALLIGAMSGCATQSARYPEIIAENGVPPDGHARIVLLRPDKRFDNYSLSRAVIRVNDRVLGKLAYGGFLFVDVENDEAVLIASARNRWYGTCTLKLPVKPGETLYVDVAPRPANVAAELAGAVAGAAIVGGGAASPAGIEEILVSEAIVQGAAASTAGGVAASAIEASGKECGGPYRMTPIAAPAALEQLDRLSWSG